MKNLLKSLPWLALMTLALVSVPRSANTAPGNKKGGLSNIVEKAMGSIIKSGNSAISGVLSPGEKVRQKGLIYAATPASDFICGTLQVAAGINLHVFTTGRGTPYSLAEVPVIKVASAPWRLRRSSDLTALAGVKSSVNCIDYFLASYCNWALFSGKPAFVRLGAPKSWTALCRNSVTLQPSLHCSLAAFEAQLRGAPDD